MMMRHRLIGIALRLIGIAIAMHGAAAFDCDRPRYFARVDGRGHHQR
jgi:hypothetical protein